MPKGIYGKGSTPTGGTRLQKKIAMGKKVKKNPAKKKAVKRGGY